MPGLDPGQKLRQSPFRLFRPDDVEPAGRETAESQEPGQGVGRQDNAGRCAMTMVEGCAKPLEVLLAFEEQGQAVREGEPPISGMAGCSSKAWPIPAKRSSWSRSRVGWRSIFLRSPFRCRSWRIRPVRGCEHGCRAGRASVACRGRLGRGRRRGRISRTCRSAFRCPARGGRRLPGVRRGWARASRMRPMGSALKQLLCEGSGLGWGPVLRAQRTSRDGVQLRWARCAAGKCARTVV